MIDFGKFSKMKLSRKICLGPEYKVRLIEYIKKFKKGGFALTSIIIMKVGLQYHP